MRLSIIICLMILSFSITFAEEENIIRGQEQSITGKLDKYHENSVTIEGLDYELCSDVKVFVKKTGELISKDDLDAAKVVKATLTGYCISTVEVIASWE